MGTKPKRRFLKFLLQPKFVDVAIFTCTGWNGTERAKDFMLIVASREPVAREEGAADQFRWHAFAVC